MVCGSSAGSRGTRQARLNRSVTISFRRAGTGTPPSTRGTSAMCSSFRFTIDTRPSTGGTSTVVSAWLVQRVVQPHDDAVAILRALDRARLRTLATSPPAANLDVGMWPRPWRFQRARIGRRNCTASTCALADAQSPACGMMLYANSCRPGICAPGVRSCGPAPPRRDEMSVARQPADAAQQRHGDLARRPACRAPRTPAARGSRSSGRTRRRRR